MADILSLHVISERWSAPLETRTLRYLLAVVREENMIRAAEQLRVTQTTLPKQMKSLGRELGNALFTHRSFSVVLIEEGRLLRRRAEGPVAMVDRITDKFLGLDDILGGDLYLGLAEPHQVCFLARKIKRFKEDCPGMQHHITSGDTEQMTEELDKGLLDFITLMEEPDTTRYEALNLPKTNRRGIVTRADGELARKARASVDDPGELLLFCSKQSWTTGLPWWADARTVELCLEGTSRLACNGSVFARKGLDHLLIFARLVDTGEDSSLAFRPLWPVLESPMYLVWRR